MERFSTIGLPTAGRAAAWNALYAQRMSRGGFAPEDQAQFDADLRISKLGPVKLAKLSVDSCSFERSQADIASHIPRLYSFLLQAEGQSTFHHCGNEAHLSEGDFVLCDTGLPHYWTTRDHSTTIMVRVEPNTLREYLPTPEQFCGLHLGRAAGLTDTVSAMVQSLTNRIELGIDAAYEGQIARHLLEMISMTYTMSFEGSGASATLWQRRKDIIRYIEEHLRDPLLSPASIAIGLRLSPRYLRTIFAISGERVSAYILRRRLEECARQMRNPAWNGHTLTEDRLLLGLQQLGLFHALLPRAVRRGAARLSPCRDRGPARSLKRGGGRGRETRMSEAQPLFDTHAHLVSDDWARYPARPFTPDLPMPEHPSYSVTVEALVAMMDERNVAQACLVQRGHLYGYDNSYIVDSAERYPGPFSSGRHSRSARSGDARPLSRHGAPSPCARLPHGGGAAMDARHRLALLGTGHEGLGDQRRARHADHAHYLHEAAELCPAAGEAARAAIPAAADPARSWRHALWHDPI